MSTEPLTDEELMRRYGEASDAAAFDALVLRYHKPAVACTVPE